MANEMKNDKNLYEKIIFSLKNKRVFAYLLILFVFIIGLGALAGAFNNFSSFIENITNQNTIDNEINSKDSLEQIKYLTAEKDTFTKKPNNRIFSFKFKSKEYSTLLSKKLQEYPNLKNASTSTDFIIEVKFTGTINKVKDSKKLYFHESGIIELYINGRNCMLPIEIKIEKSNPFGETKIITEKLMKEKINSGIESNIEVITNTTYLCLSGTSY